MSSIVERLRAFPQFIRSAGGQWVQTVYVDPLAIEAAETIEALVEALWLCYEHCKLYHPDVDDTNVGESVRAALRRVKES